MVKKGAEGHKKKMTCLFKTLRGFLLRHRTQRRRLCVSLCACWDIAVTILKVLSPCANIWPQNLVR